MLNYVGIPAKCTGIALRMLWQGLKDWGGQVSIGVGCPIPPYSTTLDFQHWLEKFSQNRFCWPNFVTENNFLGYTFVQTKLFPAKNYSANFFLK